MKDPLAAWPWLVIALVLLFPAADGFAVHPSSRAAAQRRTLDGRRPQPSATRDGWADGGLMWRPRRGTGLRGQSPATVDGGNLLLTEEEIDASMEYLARLINHRLEKVRAPDVEGAPGEDDASKGGAAADADDGADESVAYRLAKGRFHDLTVTHRGEQVLENLFLHEPTTETDGEGASDAGDGGANEIENEGLQIQPIAATDVRLVQFAIASLQSLLVYGMQVGIKGSAEAQAKLVRHLFRPGDPPKDDDVTWSAEWDAECIRRLKFHRDTRLGKLVLAKLIRKRTAQGAYDLLVDVGAWERHEDTALLRSGFPVRFLEHEERASNEAEENEHDPDALLGLRKDLRQFKVYTIDGEETLDIDDGLSVEVLDEGANGEESRYRYWIHIADVDRWAPRGSELLHVAERRGTSLYLPTATLCMFPENMSARTMSLEAWEDKHALSLGVELLPDGSVDASSIVVTPSLVHVDYRLTYDQVDEMLDEGVGYTEEWPIGAMLAAATKRRAHRVERGSTEGMVPFPIPKGMVSARHHEEGGEYDISLKIETTHNSGANRTAGDIEEGVGDENYDPFCSPVSSSQLIVTEMMILAGEAIGKWHQLQPMQNGTDADGCLQIPNVLELPYRRQPAPDFKSREREARQMDFLLSMNKRYPHAWYARRFFNKVAVSEKPGPHFGMGLDCYVQWTSPIRRLTDLQVHAALKRYLRRRRVNAMLRNGLPVPSEVTSLDLGYDASNMQQLSAGKAIDPIDYTSGLGMIFAARPIQSSSSNYWLFEYIRQKVNGSEEEVAFECVVLGCVNKDRFQYAVYVYELGLEHRYLSETGELEEGKRLWLKVLSVNPRMELLSFSLASKSGGIPAQQLSAPAA